MTERRLRDVTDLAAIVHELTTASQHRQSYRAGWNRPNRTSAVIKDHVTDQASLLVQLRDAITDRPATGTMAAGGQMVYTTLPRFSADAFDRMEAIRHGVTHWLTVLDRTSEAGRRADLIVTYLDQITRIMTVSGARNHPAMAALDVIRNAAGAIRNLVEIDLHALVSHATVLDPSTLDALVGDTDGWRTWCRIMAGWETPALRPHVPCPRCGAIAGERAGLRVRIEGASGTGGIVDDAGVRAAVCLSCDRTWDAASIPLLAEELRRAGENTVDLLDEAA